MIKHIVMFKLKEYAEGGYKNSNALKIRSLLEGLPGVIPEIIGYEIGINSLQSDNSWDVVLISVFETWDSLEKYKLHPDHVKAGEFIINASSERSAVDYEF